MNEVDEIDQILSPASPEPNLTPDTSSDRPCVWWDKNIQKWGYRPSSIGSCVRALVAARCAVESDPHSQRALQIMNEGHVHEPSIVKYCKEVVIPSFHPVKSGESEENKPFIHIHTQQKLMLTVNSKTFLAGSMDGVAYVVIPARREGGRYIQGQLLIYGIEGKALGDSTFDEMDKIGPNTGYEYQWNTYFHMLKDLESRMKIAASVERSNNEAMGVKVEDLPLIPELKGLIFAYKRRSDGEKRYYFYSQPSITRSTIEGRVCMVEQLASYRMEMLEESIGEGEVSGASGFVCSGNNGVNLAHFPACDHKSFFCNFKSIHEPQMIDGRTGLKSFPELEETAEHYWALGQQVKELEMQRKELKAIIDEALGDVQKAVMGSFECGWTDGRESLNQKALFAAYPQLKGMFVNRGQGFRTIRKSKGGEVEE